MKFKNKVSFKLIKQICCIFVLIHTASSKANRFQNAYMSFDLPDRWQCHLDNTEWVCKSDTEKQAKEAVIVFTAKEVGPTDSLGAYIDHLNSPITSKTTTGQTVTSKISIPAKQILINNQLWVEGQHLHGEVPNYVTHYLATIKDKVAVAVTYSAHKDVYPIYSTDFFKSIKSMQVSSVKVFGVAQQPTNPLKPGQKTDPIGPIGDAAHFQDDSLPPPPTTADDKQNMTAILLSLAGILAAIAVYILFKLKKKK